MSLPRVSQIPSYTVNIQTKHKHSSRFKLPQEDPTLCFACTANPRRTSNSEQCHTISVALTLLRTRHDHLKFNRVLSFECPYLICDALSLLGARDLFLLQNVQTGSGAHKFNWYRGSFPGVKWLRREVNHSHQTSAGVQNKWSHTSATPIILHAEDTENFSIYTTGSLLELELKYIITHNSFLALFCQYS